jgi:hypothetical protein
MAVRDCAVRVCAGKAAATLPATTELELGGIVSRVVVTFEVGAGGQISGACYENRVEKMKSQS